ncbi:autotransporter outer membrane beta-barrel domain-containing protein [Anianabacter salinae]|uniref:autotransporter outer membrane beta-barrel domain-containing protein n=1 Tax=Anianabacter salinae TaxID=2851023 RepID=UPI00225E0AB8|nr:autotransporter outer membrane beta-barrel domain-containing protein [Anianabacter salinae]MBV0913626.1 autotransporter outer membrane beta-barrel domain-containing protein [Anianabacter salinae]
MTRDGLFFSTQGTPGQVGRSDYNAWISAEGRFYSGAVTGFSGDLVGGVDFLIGSRMIVGALAAYNHMELSTTTTQASVNAAAVGGYFASRLDTNLYLDGYLSVAFPNYIVPGASFSATRYSASLNLTGEIERGLYRLEPFAQFKGFTEGQPAYTGTAGAVGTNDITSYTLSMGGRLTATANEGTGGIVPYVSLALDYRMISSTLAGTDTFLAPRFGVGGQMAVGRGALSLDLDTGRVRSDTTDIGGRVTYEFVF